MLKLIGILVLSSQLSVAVETEKGFVEASFANTSAGAEELLDFAEKSLTDMGSEDGVHIIIGHLDDSADMEPITDKLASLEIPYGIASPLSIRAAAKQYDFAEQSPKAVALAFRRGRPPGNIRAN